MLLIKHILKNMHVHLYGPEYAHIQKYFSAPAFVWAFS